MLQYRPKRAALTIGALLIAMALSGCLSHSGPNAEKLTYNLPTTLSIERGAALFSTNIVYESFSEDGVWLIIDGQRALKRKGDSVRWTGSFRPDTETELDLRVIWTTEEKVDLAGTAKVTVNKVAPQKRGIVTTSPITFSGPVAYGVARDSYIPGTTYPRRCHGAGCATGRHDNEYPYRQIGIPLSGKGRCARSMRAELRTVQFDDNGLRLAGIATVWLGE